MPSSDNPPTVEATKPEASQPTQAQSQSKNASGKPAKQAQDGGPAKDPTKLSGAELKKQAKAEKAARRAQAKQGASGQGGSTPAAGPSQKSEGQKGGAKAIHKRGGSVVGDARPLPFRGGSLQPGVPEQKEDKTVEFFRHLYKPRTTAIAGVSKDVHPAVLALGLQVCGFKRAVKSETSAEGLRGC